MTLSSRAKPEPGDIRETPGEARTCPTIVCSPHHPLSSPKATNVDPPISQLPTEVLSLIFYITHQEDLFSPLLSPPRVPGRFSPPPPALRYPVALRLLRVSRIWYNTAINFPLLWTTVKISSDWSLPSIQAYLSHSKLHPIELNLKASKGKFARTDMGPAEINLQALFDVLVPHIPRCRIISVCVDQSFWPLLLKLQSQFKELRAPNLETFTLMTDTDVHESDDDLEPIFRGGASSCHHYIPSASMVALL